MILAAAGDPCPPLPFPALPSQSVAAVNAWKVTHLDKPPPPVCLLSALPSHPTPPHSRAFIRAAAGDPTLPVPSPTYLLQIIYDEQEGGSVHNSTAFEQNSWVRVFCWCAHAMRVVLICQCPCRCMS
jgi:hypothetical protein